MSPERYFVREMQVTYLPQRKSKALPLDRLSTPAAVAAAFRHLTVSPKEVVVAVLLDNKLCVLGYETISVGTEDCSLVKPTCAFRAAICVGAANAVFIHNHPSGDPEPSPEDMLIYRKLADAGELLGVRVLDFLVLGSSSFTSFTELGRREPMARRAEW